MIGLFIARRKLWFTISAVLILVSLASLATRGLNLGIDFTGGVLMELTFEREVNPNEIRDVLADFGLAHSQITTDQRQPHTALIRTPVLDEQERAQVVSALGERVSTVRSDDVHLVSPVIADELIRLAVMALLIAVIGMIIYISMRFEYKFALAAIAALVHDAVITVGVFSVLGLDVSSAFIPAILTIMGYSVNDTIVLFDRVRENLKTMRKRSLPEMVNTSIQQTLRRSINTSVTTLVAVLAIYVLGGKTTQNFSLALLVGILCGTYSSMFLASPLWMGWKSLEPAMKRYVRH